MEWFFRLAAQRRPDVKRAHMMSWTVFKIPFVRIELRVLLKSRMDPAMLGVREWWRLLHGPLTLGRRVGKDYTKQHDEYLVGEMDGTWAYRVLQPGAEETLRIDGAYRYSLGEPQKYEDHLLMFPWMSREEIKTDLVETPAWVLCGRWGLDANREPS